jgi:hypothetical protein
LEATLPQAMAEFMVALAERHTWLYDKLWHELRGGPSMGKQIFDLSRPEVEEYARGLESDLVGQTCCCIISWQLRQDEAKSVIDLTIPPWKEFLAEDEGEETPPPWRLKPLPKARPVRAMTKRDPQAKARPVRAMTKR